MPHVEFQSWIRGFHGHNLIWTPFIGKTLLCSRETSNLHDPFAVKVLKIDEIVGHLPKKIRSTCSIFLRKGGTITCTVNGERRYSWDLTQGGLEIPCALIFESDNDSLISKVQKMLDHFPTESEVPAKRIKLENDKNETNAQVPAVWLSLKEAHITLYSSDKEAIFRGERLNDLHILFGQALLKQQFPGVQGLSCTLTQNRLRFDIDREIAQVCHVRNDHWIIISNILSEAKRIHIFDSVYSDIDESTGALVSSMFNQPVELQVHSSLEKQKGSSDCGVYLYCCMCVSIAQRIHEFFSVTLHAQSLFHVLSSFIYFTFPMQVGNIHPHFHAVITSIRCTSKSFFHFSIQVSSR